MPKRKRKVIDPNDIYEGGDKYYITDESGNPELLYDGGKDKWKRGSIKESIKEIWPEGKK
jgi:hypothetical protein